ncbi:ATP-binding protein [candidate division KSB1 bacterium]|nr:ATP-binding protein [candidate division KSB1 bacterium]RQW06581.1 MAG: ATP-binding protein [candidate division KSB1 bacterium]
MPIAYEYRLRIPSETDNLELIREFVTKVASKVGFNSDDIGKIELACDEACTNVIKHAYAMKTNNDKKNLDISIKTDAEKFTLVVTDHGKGFDPDSIKMPNMREYLAQLKVGGLGIYLMKTLMDEVDYQMQPGVKNQVRMVKYFADKKKPHSARGKQ